MFKHLMLQQSQQGFWSPLPYRNQRMTINSQYSANLSVATARQTTPGFMYTCLNVAPHDEEVASTQRRAPLHTRVHIPAQHKVPLRTKRCGPCAYVACINCIACKC